MQSSEQRTGQPRATEMNTRLTNKRRSNRRTLFALLIKFLLKSLNESGDIVLIHRTRSVISMCTQRNRMGDPSFSPLEDVLESVLHQIVGENHWQRAQDYRWDYLKKRHLLFLHRRQQKTLLSGPTYDSPAFSSSSSSSRALLGL